MDSLLNIAFLYKFGIDSPKGFLPDDRLLQTFGRSEHKAQRDKALKVFRGQFQNRELAGCSIKFARQAEENYFAVLAKKCNFCDSEYCNFLACNLLSIFIL